MYLKSLQLKNFRCFKDLTVDFAPGFNAIVGSNGSGKTSLLRGVSDAYAAVVGVLAQNPEAVLSQEDTRIEMIRTKDAIRFEPCLPVVLSAHGVFANLNRTVPWKFERTAQSIPMHSQMHNNALGFDRSQLVTEESKLPLFAYFRAIRGWRALSLPSNQPLALRESRLDAYVACFDAARDASTLIAWVTSKSLERLQSAVATGLKFDEVEDDELHVVTMALSRAIEGFRSIRFDFHEKAVLVTWCDSNRDETKFEHLSDGQRAFIAMVADIARRAVLLNPMLGAKRALNETPGLVLIDELELHLHPSWQRAIPNALKSAFPALQFICTTHAPQILGELLPEEIILLRPESATNPSVSYGLDASQVLEEIMGAPARSVEVEASLESLFLALERNALDVARKQLIELRKKAPEIPELVGASALLKRKELLGR